MNSAEPGSPLHSDVGGLGRGEGVGLAALDRSELWAWMDDAACRGLGPDQFFGDNATMAKGRAHCHRCPVLEVCFWWGVVAEWDLSSYRFGVWGGVGPGVRARVARVTGIDYARARFVQLASQWWQESLRSEITKAAA